MKRMRITFHLSIIGWLLASSGTVAANRYVKQGGQTPDPAQEYTSWDSAASNIQDAVVAADPNDTIWIAPDEYRLSTDEFVVADVTNVVYINKPLTLRASEPDQETLINGDGLYRCVMIEYDSHAGVNDWFILDGLTITNGWSSARGGGIFITRPYNRGWQRDAQILNCRIVGNRASTGGGALYFYTARDDYPGSVVVSNTVVRHNQSSGGGGGLGFYKIRAPRIIDSEIAFNQAASSSAGVYAYQASDMSITRTVFHHNEVTNATSVTDGGGAIAAAGYVTLNIRNSLFHNNYSAKGGGALRSSSENHLRLENCTIVYNNGEDDGAIFYRHDTASLQVINTILYHNTDIELDVHETVLENAFTNSCVAVAVTGADNISTPPEFANPAAFDFRLQSKSPCINAGLNQDWMTDAVDLDGNPRIDAVYGDVDIGAYELTHTGTVILLR